MKRLVVLCILVVTVVCGGTAFAQEEPLFAEGVMAGEDAA